MSNIEEAIHKATVALQAHSDENDLPLDFEPNDRLADLLTDLWHWADAEGIDYNLAHRRAQENHAKEISL